MLSIVVVLVYVRLRTATTTSFTERVTGMLLVMSLPIAFVLVKLTGVRQRPPPSYRRRKEKGKSTRSRVCLSGPSHISYPETPSPSKPNGSDQPYDDQRTSSDNPPSDLRGRSGMVDAFCSTDRKRVEDSPRSDPLASWGNQSPSRSANSSHDSPNRVYGDRRLDR